MNVPGLTDKCKDLLIFSLRSRRWFTPREGNTQRREKAALFNILSSFLPLARACPRDFSVRPENNRCLLRRASEFESFKMQ